MSSIKIIVMGVGGVGKSAITNRFVIGKWIEKYDPTVEESFQTSVEIDGKALQIEILDTAGQDEYTALRETFMHTGDGFLFVYSITDDQTLEELRDIRDQVLRVHPDRKVPMVVVGNKVDLAAKQRAVSTKEGQALAKEFSASFLEISAQDNLRVKESFETLIRKILEKRPSAGKEEGSGAVFGAGMQDNSGDEPIDSGRGKRNQKAGGGGGGGGGKGEGNSSKAEKTKGEKNTPSGGGGGGGGSKSGGGSSSKCFIL